MCRLSFGQKNGRLRINVLENPPGKVGTSNWMFGHCSSCCRCCCCCCYCCWLGLLVVWLLNVLSWSSPGCHATSIWSIGWCYTEPSIMVSREKDRSLVALSWSWWEWWTKRLQRRDPYSHRRPIVDLANSTNKKDHHLLHTDRNTPHCHRSRRRSNDRRCLFPTQCVSCLWCGRRLLWNEQINEYKSAAAAVWYKRPFNMRDPSTGGGQTRLYRASSLRQWSQSRTGKMSESEVGCWI